MYKKIMSFAFLAFSLAFSHVTLAASVTQKWAVTDAQEIGDDHGLWTNGLGGSENEKRHSFNSGSMLTEYDDGTAHLMATATNRFGRDATINIWFDDRQDTYAINKTAGGPVLDEWYYYANIKSGSTITINAVTYYLGMVMLGQGPVLQIGTGANDKNLAFGGSTWVDVFSDQARTQQLFANNNGYKHWDLNMNLTAVPVPAAVWLFGSALMGFVGMRRKAKKA